MDCSRLNPTIASSSEATIYHRALPINQANTMATDDNDNRVEAFLQNIRNQTTSETPARRKISSSSEEMMDTSDERE